MTVVCTVTLGNIFGSGKEVSSLGFYLPESIDETKLNAHLINLLQTDAKKTEIAYAFSVIGDYALRDGIITAEADIINLKTVQQSLNTAKKQLPSDRKDVLDSSPILSCRNGALTHAGSCAFNDLVIKDKKEEK